MPAASQQPSQSEQELIEVKGLLRTAEEQKNELAEQLKNANANVEQYRAVVLTLEDSLKKEKEVQHFGLLFFISLSSCIFSYTPVTHVTLLLSLVSLPSGDPAEGVWGSAEAAGEENFGGGENKAAWARTEEKSYRCSGKTSKPAANILYKWPLEEMFCRVLSLSLS